MALTKPQFMAPGVGKKNYLINGDMSVWQRGTSGTSNAVDAYTADRWKVGMTGTFVWGWARTGVAAKPASADRLINYCLRLSCTTADTSVAATDAFLLNQRIEGQVFAPLWQQPTTLSFWVRSSEAGTYCVSIRNGGVDRSYVQEYTIDSANTWEYKQIQFTTHPTAGTWNTTTSIGLVVGFALMSGTSLQATANEWSNGNFIATSNQVNWCSNATNTFDIALVQYERGNSATPYETRDLATEIRDCQRYYTKSYALETAAGTATNIGQLTSARLYTNALTSTIAWTVQFPVPMRVAPTVTVYNPSSGVTSSLNSSSGPSVAGASATIADTAATIYQNAAGTADAVLYAHYDADAEL